MCTNDGSKRLTAILIGRVSIRNWRTRLSFRVFRGPLTAPNCRLYVIKLRPIGTRFSGNFQTALV